MLDQFQKLDDLIVEHTEGKVRTMLRNQLALTREQVEAYQAASDKQDETLARQAAAYAALEEKHLASEAAHAKAVDDSLAKQKAAADAIYDDLYSPDNEP